MEITLYSKNDCQQCRMTKGVLDRKGASYTEINMDEDPAALDYVKGLGYLSAPVVVAGDQHWSGLRPDLLASI